MPKADKQQSLQRQWEILKTLRKFTSASPDDWDSTKAVWQQLTAEGYNVTLRTVQRDLVELSCQFPIQSERRSDGQLGWSWLPDASFDIAGLNEPQALALYMIESYIQPMLPPSMLQALQSHFQHARQKIIHSPGNWQNKIRVVPTSPLLAPNINLDCQNAIYQALLNDKQIQVTYQPINQEPKTYPLNPLAIIMRGAVCYLVATVYDYERPFLYALHRFQNVEILEQPSIVPDNFDLDDAISNGLAEFAALGATIALKLRCSAEQASYLNETPLSIDQHISPADEHDWCELTATVHDSWQLRWWLLSQGAEVEVVEPLALREVMVAQIEVMRGMYVG